MTTTGSTTLDIDLLFIQGVLKDAQSRIDKMRVENADRGRLKARSIQSLKTSVGCALSAIETLVEGK